MKLNMTIITNVLMIIIGLTAFFFLFMYDDKQMFLIFAFIAIVVFIIDTIYLVKKLKDFDDWD